MLIRRSKRSGLLKITGTLEEINWIKDALKNSCEECPYIEECNNNAVKDQQQYGDIRCTCKEFLEEKIEFIICKNKI